MEKRTWTEEEETLLEELCNGNLTVAEICNIMNIPETTVRRKIKLNNYIVKAGSKNHNTGRFYEDVISLNNDSFHEFKCEKDLIEYIYNEYYIKQKLSMKKIGEIINKSSYTISDKFKKYNLEARNCRDMKLKYNCNEDYFKMIDSEKKAYWLGFLSADGYIQKTSTKGCSRKVGLSLVDSDIRHLEKLKKDIETNTPIKVYQCKGKSYSLDTKYCRLIMTSEKLASDLIDKGCVEHKSNIIKFPTEEQVPYSLLRHYIRGYFDGNGSITIVRANKDKNRNTVSYKIRFTSTEDMLNGIQNHLLNEGIIKRLYPLSKREQEHIVSNFEFGGNLQSYKFLKWLYEDAEVYLDRKYERYLSLKKYIEQKFEEAA